LSPFHERLGLSFNPAPIKIVIEENGNTLMPAVALILKSSKMMYTRIYTVVIFALLSAPALAGADVVTADFNDLTPGQLEGQAGGSGWTGNWENSTSLDVINGDLLAPLSTNYGINQPSPGRRVQGSTNVGSQSTRAVAAALTGEIWFSFLLNQPDMASRGGIGFNENASVPSSNLRIIAVGNELRMGLASFQGIGDGFAINLNSDMLILGRLQILDGAGAETLDVWVNPTLTGDPTDLYLLGPDNTLTENATSLDGGIQRIVIQSYFLGGMGDPEAGIIDSLRISDGSQGYYDVTGVPEPASTFVLGLGCLGLVFVRRRT
jgi:hypothetical protein